MRETREGTGKDRRVMRSEHGGGETRDKGQNRTKKEWDVRTGETREETGKDIRVMGREHGRGDEVGKGRERV